MVIIHERVETIIFTTIKPEDRFWGPNVDMDAFVTSMAYYYLDLWPSESNQVIIRG